VLVAVEQHAVRRGRQYQWSYHRIGNTYAPLRRALAHVVREYPFQTSTAQAQQVLDRVQATIETDLVTFQAAYRKLTTIHAPHAACHLCQTHCRYRFEATAATQRRELREGFEQVLTIPNDRQMWGELVEHCRGGAFQVVGIGKDELPADAIICYALHMTIELDLSLRARDKIMTNLSSLLVKSKP